MTSESSPFFHPFKVFLDISEILGTHAASVSYLETCRKMANCPSRFTAGIERENGNPEGGGGKGSGEGLGTPVPTLSFYRRAWLQTEARVVHEKQESSYFQTLKVIQIRKEDTDKAGSGKGECQAVCALNCVL